MDEGEGSGSVGMYVGLEEEEESAAHSLTLVNADGRGGMDREVCVECQCIFMCFGVCGLSGSQIPNGGPGGGTGVKPRGCVVASCRSYKALFLKYYFGLWHFKGLV